MAEPWNTRTWLLSEASTGLQLHIIQLMLSRYMLIWKTYRCSIAQEQIYRLPHYPERRP